jgi:hypothetical protein
MILKSHQGARRQRVVDTAGRIGQHKDASAELSGQIHGPNYFLPLMTFVIV